jgi:hypothetical protein
MCLRIYETTLYILFYTQLSMCSGQVLDPTSQFLLPTSFFVCKLSRQGGTEAFSDLGPLSLQYWVSLTFAGKGK